MLLNFILLIVSLTMIIYGANWLTEGGAGIAKRFGLSEMVIGLTIVAFGTSAPEFVISVMSAIEGNAGIAIGNVVGSNIANILLIIGVVAIVRPIIVEKSVMSNDIPLVIIASLALLACGNSHLLDGMENIVTRVDGIMLLLFFVIFLRYTFAQADKAKLKENEQELTEVASEKNKSTHNNLWKSILLIVVGLAGLVWGGQIFVENASELASAMGVSQAIIGLTIVAVGTSLPELATSVVAAVKGHSGLAIGNVIGSCMFNIFFVLGLSAVIRPLPLGEIGNLDLLTMTGSAVLFWIAGWLIGKRIITRGEGVLFTVIYIAYIVALILNS